jgi:hypothetical protein
MKQTFIFLCSFLVNVAMAEDMENFACNMPAFAEEFTKNYTKELERVLKAGQLQTENHQKVVEKLQSKIINAGVWTKPDASLYFLSLTNLPEVKDMEEKRNKLSAEFKRKNIAISVLDIATNNNKEKINKGTCIFGTLVLSIADEANKVNDESWTYLEGKVSEFGTSQNIKMAD